MLQPAKTECGEMKQEEAKFDLMHRSLKGTSGTSTHVQYMLNFTLSGSTCTCVW